MFNNTLPAALAVIAAFTLAPSIATAASPHAAQRGISHGQPWLDWGNSFIDAGSLHGSDSHARASTRFGAIAVIEPMPVRHTMFPPPRGDAAKNVVSIEAIGPAPVFSGDAYDNEMGLRLTRWFPEVDDEVL